MWNPEYMSMQPYQQNPIEAQKQQVRKDSRNAAIALATTGVSLGLWAFVGTSWLILVILSGIAAVYYGLKVRKTISGKPNQGELY